MYSSRTITKIDIVEKLKVLVVDDEPGIRSGIKRALERFVVGYPFMDEDIGFELTEVESGEEAIELFSVNKPDIVLLDNKLPGIDGIEVLEYINNHQLDIEVMMITSFASLELAVKATNIGAYDFVPKPFTPQELRSSMENITKHWFLKRMTRKMNKEGRQIRFQFLSVLSHELKTPLNAVEGYLKIIKDRQVGDNLDDYDEMVSRSLKRIKGMRKLIMDFLDLTQIESGKKPRELKEINLTDIARLSVDSLSPLAIQKEVELELIAPESFLFTGDRDEFEIIFNNLISNAVKYNRFKGNVQCILSRTDDSICIEVSDTGIGIPENDLPKLFKEFVRIKNENTRKIAGSGLGLSIVKRIVDLYNGRIEVQSDLEKGSTFTLHFSLR